MADDTHIPSCSFQDVLNAGTDDQVHLTGYRSVRWRRGLMIAFIICTAGLAYLLFYWRPLWKVWLTKEKVLLRDADTIVVKDQHNSQIACPVIMEEIPDTNPDHADGGYTGNRNNHGSSEFVFALGEPGSPATDTTRLTAYTQKFYIRYFVHYKWRYVWSKLKQRFVLLRGLDPTLTCAQLHDNFTGLPAEQQQFNLFLYGENSIHIDVKPYLILFVEEILNPFYLFQIGSIILWSMDQYYIYAGCIFFISAISLGVSLRETKKQSLALRDMVQSTDTTINVVRPGGEVVEVLTSTLVPGDVVIIPPHGCMMTCDAVLISGTAIVNESMLTGESVPVTKTPLAPSEADEVYSPDEHKRNTLFCGTQVIQTRYYGDIKVKAIVCRTGFSTAKGNLVLAILHPRPIDFKFYKDAIKFVLMLACFAVVGMSYSIYILIRNGAYWGKVVIRTLDIITIVVPPALPAAMTVGTVYAQNRLKKNQIFCISPQRINVCGKVNCVVFDKTGTLTEEGLDMWGVVPCELARFMSAVRNPSQLNPDGLFVTGMATCHSLTVIDGELTGDPLDLKIFNSINWLLEEPGRDTAKFDTLMPTIVKPITHKTYDEDVYLHLTPDTTPFEVGIVRQFTFSSSLQRMTVITRTLGKKYMEVFCKGAPEKIVSLCKEETVPPEFPHELNRYTLRGYRVIALAYKALSPKVSWVNAQKMPRDQVERDLTFLGLVVLENMLKSQTTPVMEQLTRANVRTIMATGDNMLTAISVARQCGMIGANQEVYIAHAHPPGHAAGVADAGAASKACIKWEQVDTEEAQAARASGSEASSRRSSVSDGFSVRVDSLSPDYVLALTGRSFSIIRQYFPDVLDKVVVRGCVFARMSPDEKSQLVEQLQSLNYCVAMCGDGANDCGALKTAHAGISLSEAEASVASPFTSRTPNIECVPTVIREGRAALVTSFGVFKYMALYSIIQFTTVLILYTFGTNLSDLMFLYIDLVLITTLVILMGHTGAYEQLVHRKPAGSLVSLPNKVSIFLHISSVIAVQALAVVYLRSQLWYTKAFDTADRDKPIANQETTTLFYISSFQYLLMSYVFSKGPPFRKPVWTNVWFLLCLVILTTLTFFLTLYPIPWLAKVMLMAPLPVFLFRVTLCLITGVNLMVCIVIESMIADGAQFRKFCNRLRGKLEPKSAHKRIQKELSRLPYWPPVGSTTHAEHTHNVEEGGAVFRREDSSMTKIQFAANGS